MITFNKKKINEFCNISLLLISIIFIIIYSSLNTNNRDFIAEVLTNDISLFLIVILITIFSYYNLIGGFVLSVMFIILLLPYFKKNHNLNNKLTEGFQSKKEKSKKKKINIGGLEGEKEVEDSGLDEALTGKGHRVEKFMEKVNKYKSFKKREETFERLMNNSNTDKYNSHTNVGDTSNTDTDNNILEKMETNKSNDKTEKFNGQETIKLRRFNPNDEFDNNLLMTKEICDDIKKRIVYEYETIPYLKRYISSRLQEIIDLLDLSA